MPTVGQIEKKTQARVAEPIHDFIVTGVQPAPGDWLVPVTPATARAH
jgi:hypothetical protein